MVSAKHLIVAALATAPVAVGAVSPWLALIPLGFLVLLVLLQFGGGYIDSYVGSAKSYLEAGRKPKVGGFMSWFVIAMIVMCVLAMGFGIVALSKKEEESSRPEEVAAVLKIQAVARGKLARNSIMKEKCESDLFAAAEAVALTGSDEAGKELVTAKQRCTKVLGGEEHVNTIISTATGNVAEFRTKHPTGKEPDRDGALVYFVEDLESNGVFNPARSIKTLCGTWQLGEKKVKLEYDGTTDHRKGERLASAGMVRKVRDGLYIWSREPGPLIPELDKIFKLAEAACRPPEE